MTMKGRVAVVTGAARGIGRACVQALLEDGARVAALDLSWSPTGLSGDRDDAFYRDLAARPNDVVVIECDISRRDQIDAAYASTLEAFGTVDFLFNNAGMRMRDLYPPNGRGVSTLQTEWDDWERMFAVNVFGTMEVTKAFIKPMIEKKRGSVLTTISNGAIFLAYGGAYMALRPNSREVPYQPSKAAIQCGMFYLASEVKDDNIAVNLLIPQHTSTTGFAEQNASRRLLGSRVAGDLVAHPGSRPAHVSALVPEHCVPLVRFLADKDASTGITGRSFDALIWNTEHGQGSWDHWADTSASEAIEEAAANLESPAEMTSASTS